LLKKLPDNQLLYIIVTIGVLLRIAFIPFVQITDADATSRILIAETWIETPTFLTDGIWLPIHNYFISLSLIISGERIYGPAIFHIIITCLTIVPLYHFTKREFSEKGAWFAIVFYLLCPIIFRNSFQALSGLPHAFFIALALNSVSKSIRFNDLKQAIYAGIFMTVAAGFRYEAWLIIALFTFIFLLFKKIKLVIYFWGFSMIFPLFWMIGNYIAHNDFLFGLAIAENDNVAFGIKIERLSYFPFSWFFIYSPILAFLVGRKIYQKIKTKQLIKSRLIWSIPFWLLLLVFTFKSYEETLLMQHRFTILLILFSTPFISIIFENIQWNRIKAISFGVIFMTLIPLSYLWMKIPYENLFKFSDTLNYVFAHIREGSKDTFEAIPRISNQNFVAHSDLINRELKKDRGLILDFTSWDNTFYLAVNSNVSPKQIFILDGSENGETDLENLKERIQKYPKGVFLINHNSRFSQNHKIEGTSLFLDATCELKVSMIKKEKDVSIFRYELKNLPRI
jgi:hypothetical protein